MAAYVQIYHLTANESDLARRLTTHSGQEYPRAAVHTERTRLAEGDCRKGRFLETARQTDLNGPKSLASGNKQTPDSPIYLDTGGYVVVAGGGTQAFITVWIYPRAASLRTQGGHSAPTKGTDSST